MSWQAYVDTSLVGSGHIDQGAIVSVAGDSIWAQSNGFSIKMDEIKVIADVYKSDNARNAAYGNGLHIAGEAYAVLRIEDRTILLRAKDPAKAKIGVCIAKTTQAILIGHYDGEKTQPGNANQAVQALADYLGKSGY